MMFAAEEGWSFETSMENVATAFEVIGVAVIVVGVLYALLHGFRVFENPSKYFDVVRKEFGRPLILGLEILVAADIIKTVVVDPNLEAVLLLAVLVLVRITLSFSLDIEIDGYAPWRRKATEAQIEALRTAEASHDGD